MIPIPITNETKSELAKYGGAVAVIMAIGFVVTQILSSINDRDLNPHLLEIMHNQSISLQSIDSTVARMNTNLARLNNNLITLIEKE